MTQIDRIEQLFFEARRSAFGISFLCFIGTAISLAGIAMLDPALGIVIPILAIVVLALFTLMFLLLAFRLFQPISEIVKMVNGLYNAIIVDDLGAEPTGAGADTERQALEEVTQQVKDLKKEISALKKDYPVSSAGGRDLFWPTLIIEWMTGILLVCGVLFMIPALQNIFTIAFAVAWVVGITIIALIHAHNAGRLKWPSRLRWSRGDEK